VLEENASDEAIINFKKAANNATAILCKELINAKLFSNEKNVTDFLMGNIALASGMQQKMNMPERIYELSFELGMHMPKEYYRELLRESTQTLFQYFAHKK
jgi:hypothetical protein